MSSTVVLPQGTYPIGQRTLGPAAVPSTVSFASLQLDGTAMTDSALRLTVQIDLSLDGGTTWASTTPNQLTDPFPVTATMEGGMHDKNGNLLAVYFLTVQQIPGVGNVNRQIRATVTIAGTALTTQGTLVLN